MLKTLIGSKCVSEGKERENTVEEIFEELLKIEFLKLIKYSNRLKVH